MWIIGEIRMRLKNFLIVVTDIERSKAFYKELFGLDVVSDFGNNVMLTGGLVLQERKLWEQYMGRSTSFSGHDAELYFEDSDLDAVWERLHNSGFPIAYISESIEEELGRRVIRVYDPDHHIIEIGEKN